MLNIMLDTAVKLSFGMKVDQRLDGEPGSVYMKS